MNKISLLKILGSYPLFTINDFIKITKSKPEYARTHLYRLKKEGIVFQIERGKYTAHDDPMVYASHIRVPSYISFWTAIRYYDLTEQLPNDIMIASSRSKKMILPAATRIRFFKLKHLWGYKKDRYRGFDIFIAEKEKCIIDCLLIKNLPFDEVAKAIKAVSEIDKEKLTDYAIRTGNRALMKRLGFLLEHSGFKTDKLLNRIGSNYTTLDWDSGKKGKKNKKWKLIINWRESDLA